jgi:hypothetical protein
MDNNQNERLEKQRFLRYIFVIESISSAVKTRNKKFPVYKKGINDSRKRPFKQFLMDYLTNLWVDVDSLDKVQMMIEINALKVKCNSDFRALFHGSGFRLGVSQKMITLYAKYLWVSGQLKTRPSLIPYDGVVKRMLQDDSLVDWTELDDINEYVRITQAIEEVSNGKAAEWELKRWNDQVGANSVKTNSIGN